MQYRVEATILNKSGNYTPTVGSPAVNLARKNEGNNRILNVSAEKILTADELIAQIESTLASLVLTGAKLTVNGGSPAATDLIKEGTLAYSATLDKIVPVNKPATIPAMKSTKPALGKTVARDSHILQDSLFPKVNPVERFIAAFNKLNELDNKK